jgi:hypothetical protein
VREGERERKKEREREREPVEQIFIGDEAMQQGIMQC